MSSDQDQRVVRPRSLMVGLGGPTFISDWAKAVGRFGDVTGVTGVKTLPPSAQPVARGLAIGEVQGFEVIYVKATRIRPTRLAWRINAWLEARAMLRATRILENRDGPIDIVHSHFYSAAAWVPRLSRQLGVPFVHTEHSSNLAHPSGQLNISRAGTAILKRVLAGAAEVMAVGDQQADAMVAMDPGVSLSVVPNPVDTDIFINDRQRGAPRRRLITVGHLVERKRIDLLIRALSIVRQQDQSVSLDIVGDGDLRRQLEQLGDELGLTGAVTFYGALDRTAIAERLATSDLYVHTAAWESFGVVLIEALAAGLPIVTVKCGGVSENLMSGAVHLSESDDPGVLAAAIMHQLRSQTVPKSSVIADWAIQHYGLNVVSIQIEEIYRQALAR